MWAPDVLFELLNAGVDGVNWHIRPSILNAPFNLDDGKLVPLPELYGLAVFAQMTHGPARLVDTTVSASAGPGPEGVDRPPRRHVERAADQ